MQTRRRFLRDLGTGLLMTAAPTVAAAEAERKQWFVGRGAPVGSRGPDGWYEFESSQAVDTMPAIACASDESVGDFKARPGPTLHFGPGDDLREVLARGINERPVYSAQYIVDRDGRFTLLEPQRFEVQFDADGNITIAVRTTDPEAVRREMEEIKQAMRAKFDAWVDRGFLSPDALAKSLASLVVER